MYSYSLKDLAATNPGMSGTLEHKRTATKVVKSLGLQADLRARAVVLVAADSTLGNSLRDLIQLNEDDPALKALVEEFFRGEGTGNLQRAVDKTSRKIAQLAQLYEPVEDEITLAGYVDSLLWHVWKCMDMYDQGPKLGEDKTSESGLEKAMEELSTKLKDWGAAVHGQVQYLLCYACAGSQFQICAIRRGSSVAYRFRHLEPVGQPVLSKYFDHRPRSSRELKNSIRCILHALVVLHQAGFAHTDLRWENIILQHACQWVLIDLEFACVLNSVPFTPEGHARKMRQSSLRQLNGVVAKTDNGPKQMTVEKALNSIALDERVLLFRGSDSNIVERLSAYDQVKGQQELQHLLGTPLPPQCQVASHIANLEGSSQSYSPIVLPMTKMSSRESAVVFTWHSVVTETMNRILKQDGSDLQWQPDHSHLPTDSTDAQRLACSQVESAHATFDRQQFLDVGLHRLVSTEHTPLAVIEHKRR
ncbi:hypothetical protein WJX82_005225 [Trebouxia sp. C0006]